MLLCPSKMIVGRSYEVKANIPLTLYVKLARQVLYLSFLHHMRQNQTNPTATVRKYGELFFKSTTDSFLKSVP